MAVSWQELKQELEEQTKEIFLTCPDEIKRYHYGIITHSEAGKYAKQQYFGHWVHGYGEYYVYTTTILGTLMRWTKEPDFSLSSLKRAFIDRSVGAFGMGEYGGQKSLSKYATKMVEAFDTLQTKDELLELLKAYAAYAGRLYWWFHWYFPWGIGPTLCHRLSPEDIKEIARLGQTG